LHPVASLNWDGNWPALAAILPVRGVAQQLALQSELLKCGPNAGKRADYLRLAGCSRRLAGEWQCGKLTAVLCEHFGQTVRLQTTIGAVEHTASAAAIADRAERQREAEQSMQEDPLYKT